MIKRGPSNNYRLDLFLISIAQFINLLLKNNKVYFLYNYVIQKHMKLELIN